MTFKKLIGLLIASFIISTGTTNAKANELTKGNIESLTKSCLARNNDDCVSLSKVYLKDGVNQDYFKASKLLTTSCEGGDNKSCAILSTFKRMQATQDELVKLFVKECDTGNNRSCTELGFLYFQGKRVKQNYPKAITFLTKACTFGNAQACELYGGLYYFGKNVKKDYFRALKPLNKACDADLSSACYYLANMLAAGNGVKQDPILALKLYNKACDAEDAVANACVMLGFITELSTVVDNLRKAKQLYGKACDLESQEGCDKYRKLNQKGIQ